MKNEKVLRRENQKVIRSEVDVHYEFFRMAGTVQYNREAIFIVSVTVSLLMTRVNSRLAHMAWRNVS